MGRSKDRRTERASAAARLLSLAALLALPGSAGSVQAQEVPPDDVDDRR